MAHALLNPAFVLVLSQGFGLAAATHLRQGLDRSPLSDRPAAALLRAAPHCLASLGLLVLGLAILPVEAARPEQNPRPALCRRALLMPQVKLGSLYHCGQST